MTAGDTRENLGARVNLRGPGGAGASVTAPTSRQRCPSTNVRYGGKTLSVLVYSLLLSHGANLGFTLSITPLRYSLSYPHVKPKMSELEPILFTCFE